MKLKWCSPVPIFVFGLFWPYRPNFTLRHPWKILVPTCTSSFLSLLAPNLGVRFRNSFRLCLRLRVNFGLLRNHRRLDRRPPHPWPTCYRAPCRHARSSPLRRSTAAPAIPLSPDLYSLAPAAHTPNPARRRRLRCGQPRRHRLRLGRRSCSMCAR
jgi:hypothetical protein